MSYKRIKSGNIYAVDLSEYFPAWGYLEFKRVESIPKGEMGHDVVCIFGLFSKDLISDMDFVLQHKYIMGPWLVCPFQSDFNLAFEYLGFNKQTQPIERLPFMKTIALSQKDKLDLEVTEWRLYDFHIEGGIIAEATPEFAWDLEYGVGHSAGAIRTRMALEYMKMKEQDLTPFSTTFFKKSFIRELKYMAPRDKKKLVEIGL